MMKGRKFEVWHIVSFIILGLYALFLVMPMFQLLRTSVVSADGRFTLEQFTKFF